MMALKLATNANQYMSSGGKSAANGDASSSPHRRCRGVPPGASSLSSGTPSPSSSSSSSDDAATSPNVNGFSNGTPSTMMPPTNNNDSAVFSSSSNGGVDEDTVMVEAEAAAAPTTTVKRDGGAHAPVTRSRRQTITSSFKTASPPNGNCHPSIVEHELTVGWRRDTLSGGTDIQHRPLLFGGYNNNTRAISATTAVDPAIEFEMALRRESLAGGVCGSLVGSGIGLIGSPRSGSAAAPPPAALYSRRYSVPEKSLFNADYAILRKSIDSRIEVVGAFHKSDRGDAYRGFLESISCYDLAPQHGLLVMLDAQLTLQKAVTIMCGGGSAGPITSIHRVAIVCNARNRDANIGIFTISDCLHVLRLATAEQKAEPSERSGVSLASRTLQHFLDKIQAKKRMITAGASTSIWDLAKLFRQHRVHRIPVVVGGTSDLISVSSFDEDDEDEAEAASNNEGEAASPVRSAVAGGGGGGGGGEILSFVCLRGIFIEMLKLFDAKCVLAPDLRTLTLEETQIGTWASVIAIDESATFGDAIELLLRRRVSCLPIISRPADDHYDEEETCGRLVGVITKDHIIEAVAQHGSQNYAEVMDIPVRILFSDDPAECCVPPTATLVATIRKILNLPTNVMGSTDATTPTKYSAHLHAVASVAAASGAGNNASSHRQCIFVCDEETRRLLGVVSLADIMQYILSTLSAAAPKTALFGGRPAANGKPINGGYIDDDDDDGGEGDDDEDEDDGDDDDQD